MPSKQNWWSGAEHAKLRPNTKRPPPTGGVVSLATRVRECLIVVWLVCLLVRRWLVCLFVCVFVVFVFACLPMSVCDV